MIDRDDAERMLNLAKVDLNAIRNMLKPGQFEDSIFGFHAQQAVEKSLKSWLSLRGISYPKTHDLRVLIRLLESHRAAGVERFVGLADLTDFAVQFRYDFLGLPHGLDRPAVLSEVESLVGHLEMLLHEAEAER